MNGIPYRFTHKGNVPGGHYVLADPQKASVFVPPMKECHSIELRHSDVVVDIGAYCGTYAIRCARFPVKRVIAYEPTPATFSVLSLTTLPNLELVQAAVVGTARESVELHVSAGIGVTNRIMDWNSKASSVQVPAVAYADAVHQATVVKIDVEGAEYDFPIVQPSLRAVIIDFHPLPGKDWIGASKGIVKELEEAGFRPVVSPDWRNGWTRAGSWIRHRPDDKSGFLPMLDGKLCCGCGREIAARSRAVCQECAPRWKPKFRKLYAPARS